MPKQKKRFSKRLYVYLAFVTMAAVSLFAKPIKKGVHSLHNHLRRASHKQKLRDQLDSARQDPTNTPKHKKKRHST